jgi:hypothetical protein
MKPIIAMLFAVLAVLPAGSRASAEKKPDATAAAAADSGLSPLARKYALKREALLKEFAAKRRAMVESTAWKTSSAEKQKAELAALADEAKARDDKLTAQEDDERSRQAARPEADAASAQQERQRELDQLRIQAAQDAARAKAAP